VITVELVGGPADGARYTQIDFRPVLPTPPAFGSQNGVYRLRDGQNVHRALHPTARAISFVLFYEYQPPERLTT
jgi:hypothetical protein